MNVLAIDPAYGRSKSASQTGLALFRDKKLTHYGYLSPAEVYTVRIKWLRRADQLVIEDQFFGGNPAVMKGLVEAKCLWTVAALDRGIPVAELSPAEWQRAVCRNWTFGKGSKKDPAAIEQFVRGRWSLTDRLTPDELSAIAMGTAWMDMVIP